MKRQPRRGARQAAQPPPLLKLDLGCGQRPQDGFLGVDIVRTPGTRFVCDLANAPWWFVDTEGDAIDRRQLADHSVGEVVSSHFIEHLTGAQRIGFFNELGRVMAPGAKATIVTPYYLSMRATQDPTHQWPPIGETSYLYFNRQWRVDNKLDHYPITCDFDFTFGYSLDPELEVRSEEYKAFAIKHYMNSVLDLHVVLERRPDG